MIASVTVAEPVAGQPAAAQSAVQQAGPLQSGTATQQENGQADAAAGEVRALAPVAVDTDDSLLLAGIPLAGSEEQTVAGTALADSTRMLLSQWRAGTLRAGGSSNKSFMDAMAILSSRQPLERYLPASALPLETGRMVCWEGTQLTQHDIAAAIFWLDILSVDSNLSLSSFDTETQLDLLDAALNPKRAAECAHRADPSSTMTQHSVFLKEIKRNPAFIHFIIRDMRKFQLDVTGASVGTGTRYLQVRSGRKYYEGASPDSASRLILIGELGTTVQIAGGVASLVYSPSISWLVD